MFIPYKVPYQPGDTVIIVDVWARMYLNTRNNNDIWEYRSGTQGALILSAISRTGVRCTTLVSSL